jgi:hypothetical protein
VSALAPPWGLLLTNHSIWKHFIPTASRKTFEIGGYYSVEVVPGELAVISLNTLYFRKQHRQGSSLNGRVLILTPQLSAVRGCPSHDNSDPGNLEFKWLEALLLNYRARGMFVSEFPSVFGIACGSAVLAPLGVSYWSRPAIAARILPRMRKRFIGPALHTGGSYRAPRTARSTTDTPPSPSASRAPSLVTCTEYVASPVRWQKLRLTTAFV